MYIGTDSEHAILSPSGLISAIGKIPGTKAKPSPLPSGGYIQVDNVLVEWNSPVAESEDDFVRGIQATLSDVKQKIGLENQLLFDSSYNYPIEQLKHKKAWEIGCESDWNAWEERVNDKVCFPPGSTIRTAAAHIHVSPFEDMETVFNFCKFMDLYLAVPSLFLDLDRQRRELYGKAGAMRFKTYPGDINGAEYRVLGSFWVKEEQYIRWIYRTVKMVYDNINSLNEKDLPNNLQEIINTYNLPQAERIIKELDIYVP
jgi:hypothetical protein